MPHFREVAVDNVASVTHACDRTQRHLFAATSDQDRWPGLFGSASAQGSRPRHENTGRGTSSASQSTSSRSTGRLPPSAGCVSPARREFPAISPVFILEKSSADAKRQPPPADHVNARYDLGEMRRIAVADRRAQRGETDAGRHRVHRCCCSLFGSPFANKLTGLPPNSRASGI